MNLLKTPLWIILFLSMLSATLFHDYAIGFNLLLLNIIVLLTLLVTRSQLIKDRHWLAMAACTLISAYFSYRHGNGFTIIINFISLVMLGAMSWNSTTSFLVNGFQSIYNHFGAPIHILMDAFSRQSHPTKHPSKIGLLPLVTVIFIVLLFLAMYAFISPVFYNTLSQFDWSWFSASWLASMILSFIFLYPFFRHHFVQSAYDYDRTHSNHLAYQDRAQRDARPLASLLSYLQEIKAGVLLLILLNIILGIVNAGDSYYLFYTQELPAGMSYSEYVHNGVGTLIMSIIMVILILIFLFRGYNNFSTEGKWLKALAYLWLLQNILLVATSVLKNFLYIEEYGLTYLRIGVYIYLTLCILGLLFTFYKIYLQKNVLYLFRWNAVACYVVLLIFSIIDWNMVITHQNVFMQSDNRTTDWDYLINDLPLKNAVALEKYASENDSLSTLTRNRVNEKYAEYLNYLLYLNWRERTWKSQSDLQLYDTNKESNSVRDIRLNHIPELNCTVFDYLPKLEKLSIQYSQLQHSEKISNLHSLEQLELRSCQLDSTFVLSPLPKLQLLDLSSNSELRLSNIHWHEELLRLDLDHMNLADEDELINITHVDTLSYNFSNDSLRRQFIQTRKDIHLITNDQNTSR